MGIDLGSIGKSKAPSKKEDDAPTHLCLDQSPRDQGRGVLDLAEHCYCCCFCYEYSHCYHYCYYSAFVIVNIVIISLHVIWEEDLDFDCNCCFCLLF